MIGLSLGRYQVVAMLGEGGMGQVFRASDTKLKRQVAIKILPPSVAADQDRLARFQREAEMLASLNHPNIAGIYGIEESAGTSALVMELVEGEDLSQRIARGAIPPDEALPIARQIADALEAAHERGIIHRDLKPANIKVRADGTVKVLDFGLAKAMDPVSSSTAESMNSPTFTARATELGVILGTAAYMAPEQAKGKSVDRRADIWAFGLVLHEMLTGRRLFDAEDISETLAAVLTRDVSAMALPSTVPPRLRTLVSDCLIRDPRQRLRDIGDARLVLERIIAGTPAYAVAPASAAATIVPRWRRVLPWVFAIAGFGTAAAMALWAPRRSVPVPAETRLEIPAPPGSNPIAFAISPDGRQLVFLAPAAGGHAQLWLRPLDQTTPRALAGTEGASFPFWSPDSRSVAFYAAGLRRRAADFDYRCRSRE